MTGRKARHGRHPETIVAPVVSVSGQVGTDESGRLEFLPNQATPDGCVSAALAGVLGVPPSLLPEVNHDADDWLGEYNRRLAEGGWPFMLMTANPGIVSSHAAIDGVTQHNYPRWIGVVPRLSGKPGHHAVVMAGDKLLHDPSDTAKYQRIEMAQIKCAILVVVTGRGWGPGRNPAWEPKELCQ